LFIAEVKSSTETNEDEHIRLGLGEVLDYTHQLCGARAVRPVLVLERKPQSIPWAGVTRGVVVLLTCARPSRNLIGADPGRPRPARSAVR